MRNEQIAERKLAIMLLIKGKTQNEVAHSLDRSPRWVAKWQQRFKQQGWSGLKEQSRAPKQHGKQIPADVRMAICEARQELEAEAELGEGLRYVGGQAIRTRLKNKNVRPLPSVPTIERVLREARLTRPKSAMPQPTIWYPHLKPKNAHQLHQVDIVPHYLQGGERMACFNAIDVVSRYPSGWAFQQRRAQDAVAFLVHMWQEMGIADYTQVDNEGCFSGGATHPHVLGQVVRLALSVGTELVFSPVYHPQSNGHVERFHQDYNRHVWENTYLENMATVNEKGQHFFALYRQRESHSQLAGRSPAVLHHQFSARALDPSLSLPVQKLPLSEGRIHFLRQVSPDGVVRVLNVNWHVPRFDPLKGVWVTIEFRVSGALLSIFDAAPDEPERDCLATYAFPLNEPVLPFSNSTTLWPGNEAASPIINKQSSPLTTRAQEAAPELKDTREESTEETNNPALPPLWLIQFGGTLLKRRSQKAIAKLQRRASLTRRANSTMY